MINNEEILKIEQSATTEDKRRAIYLSMKERLEDIVKLMNMMGYGDELTLLASKQAESEEELVVPTFVQVEPEEELVVTTSTQAEPEEKIDIFNAYVCACSDGSVDLFEKSHFARKDAFNRDCSGNIYIGVYSKKIGITYNHFDYGNHIIGISNASLYSFEGRYQANVEIITCIGFEDIRSHMHKEGLISDYERHKASKEEIAAVLAYAQDMAKGTPNNILTTFTR
ncbi:MAG: hypothetical protein K2J20_04735 [Bacilli bacterium]|nr:hypothetical protein [Bacilli bacterium]